MFAFFLYASKIATYCVFRHLYLIYMLYFIRYIHEALKSMPRGCSNNYQCNLLNEFGMFQFGCCSNSYQINCTFNYEGFGLNAQNTNLLHTPTVASINLHYITCLCRCFHVLVLYSLCGFLQLNKTIMVTNV